MDRVLHTERLRLRAPQPGDEPAAVDGRARNPHALVGLACRLRYVAGDTTFVDYLTR